MKTLIDLFQQRSVDYDLIEDERFGTVAVLHQMTAAATFITFNEDERSVLDDAGAKELHFCYYVPFLTDEDILALTSTGNPVRNTYALRLPEDIADAFYKKQRGWLFNYWRKYRVKPEFRAERIERLAFIFAPWVVYGLVKMAF